MQISILGTDGAYLANNGSNAISILGPDGNLLPNDGANFVCVTGSDGAYQPNDGTVEAFSILGTDGALLPYVEGNSFSVLDENGALAIPVTDNLISPLLWGGAQGAWYDPSDLSTMFLSSSVSTPITATGQTVGLILDKRLGLAQTSNLVADPDTGTMNPGGTSPPTFSTTTYLGASCRQIVFNPPTGAAGYAVSNAITPNQSNVPATVGALHLELEFSLSRPLTGDEEVWFYAQAPVATYAPGVKAASSAAAVGAWARVSAYQVTSLTSATNIAVYVTGTWSVSAPLTVYVRALTINKVIGNHAFQATAASRPIFRDVGGLRYLEFDGVDDALSTAAFAIGGSVLYAGVGASVPAFAASSRILVETSVNSGFTGLNPGRIMITSPQSLTARAGYRLTGTTGAPFFSATPAGPATQSVLSFTGNMNGATDVLAVQPRVDGLAAAGSYGVTPYPPTGTIGSYAMYIGARAGTSLFFGGNLFGLIIAGAATIARAQLNAPIADKWLGAKSGVTVP